MKETKKSAAVDADSKEDRLRNSLDGIGNDEWRVLVGWAAEKLAEENGELLTAIVLDRVMRETENVASTLQRAAMMAQAIHNHRFKLVVKEKEKWED